MLRNRAYHLIFAGAILVVFVVNQCESQGGLYPNLNNLNLSRAGICTLEVPTIDLISTEDRRAGQIPRGNGSRSGFSKIDICCSGWTAKPRTHLECEPVCDNGCENGNCTAPNVCVCRRGYVKDHNQNCIPTCPIGCLNGVCTNRGVCSCNAGYQTSPDGKYCTPVCSGGCGPGGECVGAEACRCQPGFTLDRQTNKCGYHCEGGCQNGQCVGPNQCMCKQGFKLVGGACVAECPRGCQNGICIGPNQCTCQNGWTLDRTGTRCEAGCREPCLNADCTGPDTCTCKKGYEPDPTSIARNKCIAACPGGCMNGVCSAPNFCICNPGFVKESKGSSRCVRRLKREAMMHFELIPSQDEE